MNFKVWKLSRPITKRLVLSPKMQLWAEIKGISLQNTVAILGSYDEAKRNGLARIDIIQLEVENALILATKGRYKRVNRAA